MQPAEKVTQLARLTADHPEVAVELVDRQGRIRFIFFNGMSHPECLPTGGKRAVLEHDDPFATVEAANIFPRELYEDAARVDYEPIATGVSLDEAIRVINQD